MGRGLTVKTCWRLVYFSVISNLAGFLASLHVISQLGYCVQKDTVLCEKIKCSLFDKL